MRLAQDYSFTPAVPDATRTDVPGNAVNLDLAKTKEGAKKIEIKFIPQVTIPGTRFEKGVPVSIDENTIGAYISDAYRAGMWIAGIFAVMILIIGGYRWLIAAGNQAKISGAKTQIGRAFKGLAVLLLAYVLLISIDDRLVAFNGLGLKAVSLQVIETPKGAPVGGWDGQKNITEYDNILSEEGGNLGLDCTLLKAIMLVESGGNPKARSRAGACGLMQVVPSSSNIRSLGCDLLLNNPVIAIRAGAQLFDHFSRHTCPSDENQCSAAQNCRAPSKFSSDIENFRYAIAAYNGGSLANCANRDCVDRGIETRWECRVNQGGYVETERYVDKVMTTYNTLAEKNWGC